VERAVSGSLLGGGGREPSAQTAGATAIAEGKEKPAASLPSLPRVPAAGGGDDEDAGGGARRGGGGMAEPPPAAPPLAVILPPKGRVDSVGLRSEKEETALTGARSEDFF